MATLDIFRQDAFKLQSMLAAINEVDHLPQQLGQMGIFTPTPVRTQTVSIEKLGETLSLIQTSQRGEPAKNRETEKRDIRDFRTVRIAKKDRITSSELADIRAFGTESEFLQVQTEVARRLMGPGGLANEIELTLENMRLGAIQGIVPDADGSTLINWYTVFGVNQPNEIDFDLDNASPASGALMKACDTVVDSMRRAAKGAWNTGTLPIGLCGSAFWRDLIAHPEVRAVYQYMLQGGFRDGLDGILGRVQRIEYGGIVFVKYWGTDDDTSVAIGTDKCKFFPANSPGVFKEVFSPGEQFAHIGQLGQRLYPLIVPDRDRDMYADIEVYSYPMHVCTRPLMLQRAKRT
ncbi:major capsid protein [Methylomonas rapida]|uniref:Major capsid protein n=1 Tax=Methylomonas rapida TaxID=2963939 RepID=A0ABY7GJY1_9GAMM|nr:major capsid protein [Methylomonas rapida]WAR42928.1 major capsid protein [Methylomonas rapida]